MSMKINRLEIENVKRVKAVKIEPDAAELTLIGGRNGRYMADVVVEAQREVERYAS